MTVTVERFAEAIKQLNDAIQHCEAAHQDLLVIPQRIQRMHDKNPRISSEEVSRKVHGIWQRADEARAALKQAIQRNAAMNHTLRDTREIGADHPFSVAYRRAKRAFNMAKGARTAAEQMSQESSRQRV